MSKSKSKNRIKKSEVKTCNRIMKAAGITTPERELGVLKTAIADITDPENIEKRSMSEIKASIKALRLLCIVISKREQKRGHEAPVGELAEALAHSAWIMESDVAASTAASTMNKLMRDVIAPMRAGLDKAKDKKLMM